MRIRGSTAHRKSRAAIAVLSLAMLAGCLPSFETPNKTMDAVTLSPFHPIAAEFRHTWTEPSHPFTGAAVIDIDGDGRDEIFVGGGRGEGDALLSLEGETLRNIIAGRGLDDQTAATHGAVSTDMDQDGDVDLVVARETGLTLYLNEGTHFNARPIR
jgi:hypothetical protein